MVCFISQYSLAIAALSASGYFIIGFVVPILATRDLSARTFRNEVGDMTSFLLDNLRGLKEIIQFQVGKQRLFEMDYKLNALTQKERRFKFFEGFLRGQDIEMQFVLANLRFGIAFQCLGLLHLDNVIGFTSDRRLAVQYFTHAAEVFKIQEAMEVLGKIYLNGFEGIGKDVERGIKWLKQAGLSDQQIDVVLQEMGEDGRNRPWDVI
jgi:ABC-type multidrug transport system fused ATPase/permease subunit